MSGKGKARRSVRNTGQRKNQNARDSDPKPKNKKRTSKRGTKLKGVPKGGELGTLFEDAARSGPRFGPGFLALLAGYENLTAPNAIMQS
jgi:hypothetical protein